MKKVLAVGLILTLAIAFTACSQNKEMTKEQKAALKVVEQVKADDYFTEDAKEVEKLVDKTKKEIEKETDKKKLDKVLEGFNKDLAKIPIKKAQLDTFKASLSKSIEKMAEDKKGKANEIITSYTEKIDKLTSKADMDKLSKEITDKITSETGEKIEAVKADDVKKAAPKPSVSGGSSSNSSGGTSNSSSGSSSGGSGSSSSSGKTKVWVVDQAAWTETVTKYREQTVTKYKCIGERGEKIVNTYEEGYAYYMGELEAGYTCSFGPVKITEQVPYTETITHEEEGHYEWQ